MNLAVVLDIDCYIPNSLDGSQGTNRGNPGECRINENTDREAFEYFLAHENYSKNTKDLYRKEFYRFSLWSHRIKQKAVSSLNVQDLYEYTQFLKDPLADWCSDTSTQGWHRSSIYWKPFVGRMSPESYRVALSCLRSTFSFLHDTCYLRNDPMATVRVPKCPDREVIKERVQERCLSKSQIAVIYKVLESNENFNYVRMRFAISLMFYLGLRINEVATHSMNAFRKNKRDEWWFRALVKGNKIKPKPVPREMLVELERYRRYLGLEGMPWLAEETPLIMGYLGQPIGRRRISQLLKEVLHQAAEVMGGEDGESLRVSSAHWFRHTYVTEQINNGTPKQYVQANAGHLSGETTDIYVHTDDKRRHDKAQDLTWREA